MIDENKQMKACCSALESVYFFMVIPLTHHKNSGYTELKVFGVYLSPAAGGGKIWGAQLSFCSPLF